MEIGHEEELIVYQIISVKKSGESGEFVMSGATVSKGLIELNSPKETVFD